MIDPYSTGKGFVLFSGANDRAVLALCRGFEKHNVPFGLIARGEDDLLRKSRYADRFLAVRTSEDLRFEDVVTAAQKGNERYGVGHWVVCATSEYLNIRLFAFTERLLAEGIEVSTCDRDLYMRVSDKGSFRSYSTELGVAPPSILQWGDEGSLSLGFVAKPLQNLSPEGRILYPYLVRTPLERRQFLDEPSRDRYYLERFIHGESWYLLYYFKSDGSFTMGAQRNYLQQGKGKSILVASSEQYPDSEVPLRFSNALTRDGYRGFIMIELKRTAQGESVAIEANPRCWGPFQLTLDAGMGLFEAYLEDHGIRPRSSAKGRSAFYCWTGGSVQALRSGKGLDLHASWLLTFLTATRALFSDVYARRGSWSCFVSDLCRS